MKTFKNNYNSMEGNKILSLLDDAEYHRIKFNSYLRKVEKILKEKIKNQFYVEYTTDGYIIIIDLEGSEAPLNIPISLIITKCLKNTESISLDELKELSI